MSHTSTDGGEQTGDSWFAVHFNVGKSIHKEADVNTPLSSLSLPQNMCWLQTGCDQRSLPSNNFPESACAKTGLLHTECSVGCLFGCIWITKQMLKRSEEDEELLGASVTHWRLNHHPSPGAASHPQQQAASMMSALSSNDFSIIVLMTVSAVAQSSGQSHLNASSTQAGAARTLQALRES